MGTQLIASTLPSLDYPAGSLLTDWTQNFSTDQERGWQDPPLHQYPIFPQSSSQRLRFSQSDASSQKAFQKEASAILSKATNAVDWPLVND